MPMIGMIYPSSAGKLTCVNSLEVFVSALLPPYLNDS
jgi:hypothetical protein